VEARAQAQGERGGDGEAASDQQQAGEQAAIATEQRTLMGKFHLDPAEQLQLTLGIGAVAEHQVLVVDRQQKACGVLAAEQADARLAGGRRVEHARSGMGQQSSFGVEKTSSADVRMLERLSGDAFELLDVVLFQRSEEHTSELQSRENL